MSRSNALASLHDRLAPRPVVADARSTIQTPWDVGLRLGAVHEWIGCRGLRPCDWSPPRCLLTEVGMRAVHAFPVARVLWIGRRCWPWPLLLGRSPALLSSSFFIDPPDAAAAVWAMDVALRSPTPVMVIADGHRLSLPHTRRLQLVASEHGSICMLSRPPSDESELSAACTRWRVEPSIGDSSCPRWAVTLLRNKDDGALTSQRPSWVVEWNDATGAVHLPAPVAGRAGGSATATGRTKAGAA